MTLTTHHWGCITREMSLRQETLHRTRYQRFGAPFLLVDGVMKLVKAAPMRDSRLRRCNPTHAWPRKCCRVYMATKKKDSSGGILVEAAQALGSAVGAVASATGMASPAATPAPVRAKAGKLPKKNKQRLPRRQKKALQSRAAKSA